MRVLPVALTIALLVHGTAFGQDGPIAAGVRRSAHQLAAQSSPAGYHPADTRIAVRSEYSASARVQPWTHVERLAPGARIIVTVIGGESLKCRFLAADDGELLVSDAAGMTERFARDAIAEIEVLATKDFDSVSRTVRPFVLLGLAAGVGIGVGYCASHGCNGQGWAVGTSGFGMVGALVGGGVGAGVALTRDRTVVIYRAP